MEVKETIIQLFAAALREAGQAIPEKFENELVLMESGLDSLGFAVLVARLEQELGYDPFVLMEEPVYPRTFEEFVAVYEKYADHAEKKS